jgi:hypothetical protein
MRRSTRGLLAALACLAAAAHPATAADPWPLPSQDACSPAGGRLAPGKAEDATPLPFQPGDTFGVDRLAVLQSYLPAFLWQERERFFYDGMRLEIGPCFRDYAPPGFFRQATAAGAGKARLDEAGGLRDYGAGLPFDPAQLAADDPQAGLRWLWNVEHRYQAAGFRGRFRLVDLVGRIGRAEPFTGEMFKVLLTHRADRPGPEHEAPSARGNLWVAGGLFFTPFDAREHAWRQYRNVESMTSARRTDDLHAYLPQWRRVRRISAANTEGLYMPSFSVGVVQNQQLPIAAAGAEGAGGGVGGSAAVGVPGGSGTLQTKRSGFEGLELRPNLYAAKVVGLHDVLAPINLASPLWPANEDRDFGPWGLSFASDRWELRRALVLDAAQRAAADASETARMTLYVDLQTLQPLYVATFDTRGEMTNVGIYASRWSEDRPDYPRWPDDPAREVRVLDPVGAAFANLAESGSWRRESWDAVSTPPPDDEVKRMISTGELTKRR